MEELLLEDLPSINFESDLAPPSNEPHNDFLETLDFDNMFTFSDTSLVGQLHTPAPFPLTSTDLCDQFINEDPLQPTAPTLPDLSQLGATELHELMEERYVESSVSLFEPHRGLFLRWKAAPPDRVHATSPSKLGEGRRAGGTFHFTLELVAVRENHTFGPFPATEDQFFQARVYGKKKCKSTSSPRTEDEVISVEEMKHLELNPIGKPLLIVDSDPSNVQVIGHLKKGSSVVTFAGVSLTCGSNAARSQNAPASARVWDWEYYLSVSTEKADLINTKAVIPKHITTDSNRSQTREKRKRPDLHHDVPPAKRAPQFPVIAPYGPFPSPAQASSFAGRASFAPFYPALASFPNCPTKLAM